MVVLPGWRVMAAVHPLGQHLQAGCTILMGPVRPVRPVQREAELPLPAEQRGEATGTMALPPRKLLQAHRPPPLGAPAPHQGFLDRGGDVAGMYPVAAVHVAVQRVAERHKNVMLLLLREVTRVNPQPPLVLVDRRLLLVVVEAQNPALKTSHAFWPHVKLQGEVLQNGVPEKRPGCIAYEGGVRQQRHHHDGDVNCPMLR
mmetsp:Transcript_46551/g.83965  ORF Transcript_46551/g.83965 Transcript_46551/m.83965 type:complete len:201 (-) Transcript_46551:428-1030(-)